MPPRAAQNAAAVGTSSAAFTEPGLSVGSLAALKVIDYGVQIITYQFKFY